MAITSAEAMIERMKDPFFHHHILADQIIALRAMFLFVEKHPHRPIPSHYYYQAGLPTPLETAYRIKQALTPTIRTKRRRVVTPVIGGIADAHLNQGYIGMQDYDREEQARLVIKRSLSQIGIRPDDDDDEVRNKVLNFFKHREEISQAWDKAIKDGNPATPKISENTKIAVSNQDNTIGALVTLIKNFGWFKRGDKQ